MRQETQFYLIILATILLLGSLPFIQNLNSIFCEYIYKTAYVDEIILSTLIALTILNIVMAIRFIRKYT